MLYLTNSFSINMLPTARRNRVLFRQITAEEANDLYKDHSQAKDQFSINAIGHADTDSIVRGLLPAVTEAGKRLSVKIENWYDTVLVAQYTGPRLPEGATTLPEGAKIEFFAVSL